MCIRDRLTTSPSISGTIVSVTFGSTQDGIGVTGVIYEVSTQCFTSLGQELFLNGYVAIIPDLI